MTEELIKVMYIFCPPDTVSDKWSNFFLQPFIIIIIILTKKKTFYIHMKNTCI